MNLEVGQHSMAEILASHIDKILRKGGMVGSEFSVEEMLD
jgi:hypothetical protein